MSLLKTCAAEHDGFCLLAATLLDALPSSGSGMLLILLSLALISSDALMNTDHPVPDTLLMQLHSIFGPMLLSALQLIDRREGNSPFTAS